MTPSPRPFAIRLPGRGRPLAWLLALIGGLAVLAALPPAGAAANTAAAATKVVRYRGWHARVPAGWPVYRLGIHSHTCVRFDRHAVYLGRPGTEQHCPAHSVGRTGAVLVTPQAPGAGAANDGADALSPAGTAAASGAPTAGAVAEVVRAAERVSVTATWGDDPGAVRAALGVRSVRAAGHAYARAATARTRAAAARGPRTSLRSDARGSDAAGVTFPGAPIATGPATAGEVYTGLGFDACSAPSTDAMAAWAASPFRAVGVYIGGENMACSQTNLTAAWASAETLAGWHLIPIYVGPQAPNNGCGCAPIVPASATAEGTAAAEDAVAEAEALGLGPGNPVYYDMENYARTATASASVLAFLQAWTIELHLSGFAAGVYSSELSGIEDLVAEQGTGYIEPDDIWIANWNGQQSTDDSAVPVTEWADHQRLHQYRGGHTDDYGGTEIDIDSDYLDAATASPGSGTLTTTIAAAPTLTATPQANGTIELAPSWSGESGVSRWEILGGTTPTALGTMLTVPASHHTVLTHNGYPYFQVEALSSSGQTLGTSGTIVTRPHVAIFGRSAFVPTRGPGGLPVECFGITACRASTTIYDGHHLLVRTPAAPVAAGGGIAHFPLTARAHRLVARAGNAGLPVTVTVRTSTGRSAKQTLKLVPFTVSGAGPQRVPGAGPAVRVLGGTDFVSHGWSGGILVACVQSAPCTATPALTVAGNPIATAGAVTIGAGEVGYLRFRMTSAGHRDLMRAPGNQLGARLTVTTAASGLLAGSSASAVVSLDSF